MFKKTPFVFLQHDETDCAPACLATICKYYGKEISIRVLRNLVKTDIKGTTGDKIVEGANKLGFSCHGVFSSDKTLHDKTLFPIIAHTQVGEIEHYVVVFSINKRKVLIGDPAVGLVKKSLKQFISEWSGVFFVLKNTDSKTKIYEKKKSILDFFYLIKPYKKILAEVFIASVILSFIGIVSAFYFRFLVDDVLYSGVLKTLHVVSLGYLIAIVFQSILTISRTQLILHVGSRIEATLNFDFFEHLLHLPLGFFARRKTGEVLSRINDIHAIRQVLSSTGVGVLLDSLMLLIGGAFLVLTGGILTLIAIVPVIFSTIIALMFIRPYKRMIREKAIIDAQKYSTMVESVNGISTIKALSSEEYAFECAEMKIVESTKKTIAIGRFANIENTVQMCLSQLGTLSVYWIGGLLILKGKMSLGELISFSILSGYFLGPLSRLLTLQPTLQEAFISASRMQDIMDEKCESEILSGKTTAKDLSKDDIVINDLSFSYDGDRLALENINLKIKAKSKIAFVGSSGSGKTTLIKLIMRFYDYNDGSITVGDTNIKDFETQSYRSKIAYVPQEVLLFSGTIKENIVWGSSVPDELIITASKSVKAHTFIDKLKHRYETMIGEHGVTISGGERQRIALARAILRNPSIFIFDEATASLDAITEKEIMDNIYESIAVDKTTIIVAHKLSTIIKCDQIYVFDNGKIVESGTHDELLKSGSFYKKLWDAQNGG